MLDLVRQHPNIISGKFHKTILFRNAFFLLFNLHARGGALLLRMVRVCASGVAKPLPYQYQNFDPHQYQNQDLHTLSIPKNTKLGIFLPYQYQKILNWEYSYPKNTKQYPKKLFHIFVPQFTSCLC